MTKEQLLLELSTGTYIMIKPSVLHGIGVFAIRDIPKGCRAMFSKNIGNWIKVPKTDVDQLPKHAIDLVENYCLYDEEHYFIADYGFKVMDLVNFLNHSDKPNIISIKDGEEFETLRDIKTGEELLINYGEIVDSTE
jgi:SET domain-containing protein